MIGKINKQQYPSEGASDKTMHGSSFTFPQQIRRGRDFEVKPTKIHLCISLSNRVFLFLSFKQTKDQSGCCQLLYCIFPLYLCLWKIFWRCWRLPFCVDSTFHLTFAWRDVATKYKQCSDSSIYCQDHMISSAELYQEKSRFSLVACVCVCYKCMDYAT